MKDIDFFKMGICCMLSALSFWCMELIKLEYTYMLFVSIAAIWHRFRRRPKWFYEKYPELTERRWNLWKEN